MFRKKTTCVITFLDENEAPTDQIPLTLNTINYISDCTIMIMITYSDLE